MVRNRQRKVVIVGAGPGGLASAMLLARGGADVTVLERLDRVGGRTSTFGEEAGFRFDLGPTFFMYPRVLRDVFSACDMSLDDRVPMVRLDPQYRLQFEDGTVFNCTGQVERMQAEIARVSPNDAESLPAFLADNRRKLEAFRPILERPFRSLADVMAPSLMKAGPLVRPWASLDGDLQRFFSDWRVRLAFSFQAKYLGMSPFKCPSLFSILSFLEYEHGVYHPIGGCAAVSEAMAEAARELGAKIHLSEPVRELRFDGRRATGAVTDQAEYSCDALMVNADFAHAIPKLVPNRLRRKWTDDKIAKKKYSCSTFMLYLGVEGRTPELPHHTVYLPDSYHDLLDDIDVRHRLSNDPAVYVQNATVTDPSVAPEGMSTLYVLAPVSHQHENIRWPAERERFRRVVLDQLPKMGLPADLESRIRYERMITPDDWATDMAIYRGATFNLAHSLDQMLHLRPQNRFSDLESVYLVGGGTHPGSGLPVIYESARISSRLLLEDLGLASEWVVQSESASLLSQLDGMASGGRGGQVAPV